MSIGDRFPGDRKIPTRNLWAEFLPEWYEHGYFYFIDIFNALFYCLRKNITASIAIKELIEK